MYVVWTGYCTDQSHNDEKSNRMVKNAANKYGSRLGEQGEINI